MEEPDFGLCDHFLKGSVVCPLSGFEYLGSHWGRNDDDVWYWTAVEVLSDDRQRQWINIGGEFYQTQPHTARYNKSLHKATHCCSHCTTLYHTPVPWRPGEDIVQCTNICTGRAAHSLEQRPVWHLLLTLGGWNASYDTSYYEAHITSHITLHITQHITYHTTHTL